MNTPVDASYLADAVILLRYFEARGEVRQAISVMKKRGGRHERTIREFRLDGGRITVGDTLREFRGVLTGVPVLRGFPHRDEGQRVSATAAALERDRRVLFLPTTAMDGSTTKGTLSSMGIRLDCVEHSTGCCTR